MALLFNFTGKTLVALITLTCSTSFMLFGYDQGVLSGLIGADNQFGKDFDHPDANTQGLIVSVYQLGNVAGSIGVFFCGDYLGRKKCIIYATLIMLIGAVLQTAAMDRGMMYAARIITGVGNGANTSTIPVWQSETSTAKERGKLVAIDSCIIIFGILIAYWMDYGFAMVSGPAQWRFPVGFQLVFIVIVLVLITFLPESPRWLHKQGRHDEGDEVIARLLGSGISTSDPRVQQLSRDITDAIEMESAGGPFKMRECFSGGKLQNFRRLCICFAVDAFQQLGGICVITYYLPKVLSDSVGMSRHMSLLMSGIITTEYFLASIAQIFIVNHFNRRTCLFLSSAGEIIAMLVLAGCVSDGRFSAGIVAVVMVFLYNSFYAFGWLTVPFVYPAEITTLRLRAKGTAVASVGAWLIEFMVVQITPICVQNIGYKTYILFAVFNIAIIVPVTYCFFPETANMRLEDIDFIFDKGGITGGVLGKGGRFADRRVAVENAHAHGALAESEEQSQGTESPKVEMVYQEKV